ncbi:magnesium (Mg) transporter 10 [Actinidia rufa]|uniref:Magnesium (Mg) transporter 10 n=1 Tax=Actinidia rufa TaxID=165716 RepID=A0A7J0H3Z2_9ERIC|nr:magnesium (Mg) transporter 10 [Actinidia rufa]
MAVSTSFSLSTPNLLQLPLHSPSPSLHRFLFTGDGQFQSSSPPQILWRRRWRVSVFPISVKLSSPRVRCMCLARSTEENQWNESENLAGDGKDARDDDVEIEPRSRDYDSVQQHSSLRIATGSSSDLLSLGIREPVYEVREHAILLNLGSLRAIAMQESVFIFNYNRKGEKAFIDALLPRLNPKNMNGVSSMPFELEVQALLEVLPNRLTADILEQLRISKQTLVELDSKAGALKQMLLDILEDPHEIRKICIMGRNCILKKGNDDMECSVPLEKQIAEEEEEEIEMLLENYLQRCESCHGQAERLLDYAKEMEDSIAVNLSSRRLEVSRVELLLQVGTFCIAVGALVSGDAGTGRRTYFQLHEVRRVISVVPLNRAAMPNVYK